MVSNISGVILAGGASKRFNGIIKAKIIIDGKTIISRILETFTDFFDEIIIVTNTPDEFKEYNTCIITGDQFLNKGPLGGIHTALKESEKEAVFVVAGDMPLLNKEIIIKQIDFYNRCKCDILVPKLDEYIEPLHGIYMKTLLRILEDYLEGDNDYSINKFLRKADVCYLQLEGCGKNKRAFSNINFPEDVLIINKLPGDD
jgi:molybdopterin-guanine dinucleotide biosynthesis protein A